MSPSNFELAQTHLSKALEALQRGDPLTDDQQALLRTYLRQIDQAVLANDGFGMPRPPR